MTQFGSSRAKGTGKGYGNRKISLTRYRSPHVVDIIWLTVLTTVLALSSCNIALETTAELRSKTLNNPQELQK